MYCKSHLESERPVNDMPQNIQLYIAFYSPSIALRFLGEVVLPGGGDYYKISKEDGAFVLRSRYITEWENETHTRSRWYETSDPFIVFSFPTKRG